MEDCTIQGVTMKLINYMFNSELVPSWYSYDAHSELIKSQIVCLVIKE